MAARLIVFFHLDPLCGDGQHRFSFRIFIFCFFFLGFFIDTLHAVWSDIGAR